MRVRQENKNESKKREMKGEGEGREGNAWPQTPRFWKTASDWFGAAINTLIKPGCFAYVGRSSGLFESCMCKSLSDLSWKGALLASLLFCPFKV